MTLKRLMIACFDGVLLPEELGKFIKADLQYLKIRIRYPGKKLKI